MCLKNTTSHYGSISKFLHWFIFLLVFIQFTLGYFMGDVPNEILRGQVVNSHKLLGVFILMMMVLRMIWALMNVKPALPIGTAAWHRWSERGLHILLYTALIAMPLSGWIGAVAAGKPPHLASVNFDLPITQSKPLAHFAFGDIHNPLAIIIMVLVGIHVLAALYHHFYKKDDILRRMMPHGRHD